MLAAYFISILKIKKAASPQWSDNFSLYALTTTAATSGDSLLFTTYTGLVVILALLNFGQHALFLALTPETLQSGFDRFVLTNCSFHYAFPSFRHGQILG